MPDIASRRPTAIAWYMCLSEGLSFFRAQQSGGMFIEENRRVRVRAQDGRRRQRADFAFEAGLYCLRFSCLGNDCKDFLRLQDLAHGHGNRPLGNVREVREPGLSHLLAAAGLIQVNDEIGFFGLEIRRRVIERQMAILADSDKATSIAAAVNSSATLRTVFETSPSPSRK